MLNRLFVVIYCVFAAAVVLWVVLTVIEFYAALAAL